jgi:hypothetical protein
MTYTGAWTSKPATSAPALCLFFASQPRKSEATTTEKVLLLVMFLAIGGSGVSLFMSDSSHIATCLSSKEQPKQWCENGLAMHQPMQLALASLPGSLVGESACPPEGRYEQQH